MLKGIFIVIDGLGDLACKKLGGKTPLEASRRENLDYLASNGKLGIIHPIKPGVAPESDTAIIAMLGNEVMGSFRGQLETMGVGIKLQRGDLALRTNFATIDNLKSKRVIDRRAGRTLTTREANKLAGAINTRVKLPCKFYFKNTVQHRGVLVFKGGFSDNVTNTDSAYHTPGKIANLSFFKFSRSLDDEENSEYTANILNEFIEQSYKILNDHPVNKARRRRGLLPANVILTRDASIEPPRIRQFKKWASVAYMPLEIGIAKASNMKVYSFSYPEMKEQDVYANLYAGLKKASKFSRKILKRMAKKHNYFYIHFKETDVPGHDNKPEEKKYMLEFLDNNFFSFIRKYAERNKIKLIITGDHSTPCNMKTHSADPVPLLFCDWSNNIPKSFTEKDCRKGKLGKLYGKSVLKLFD